MPTVPVNDWERDTNSEQCLAIPVFGSHGCSACKLSGPLGLRGYGHEATLRKSMQVGYLIYTDEYWQLAIFMLNPLAGIFPKSQTYRNPEKILEPRRSRREEEISGHTNVQTSLS